MNPPIDTMYPMIYTEDMTRQELLERLKEINENSDTEGGHIEADEALIEYINDEDIKKAYDDIRKWYA